MDINYRDGYLSELLFYLHEYHPEVLEWETEKDKKELEAMLLAHVDHAKDIISNAFKSGQPQFYCEKLGIQYLHEGWGGSKLRILEEIIEEHHPEFITLIKEQRLKNFILKDLVIKCSAIFSQYDLTEDYFESTESYEKMTQKLESALSQYIGNLWDTLQDKH